MEGKSDIYHLWLKYTTENDEKAFREFIDKFITTWESKLQIDWSNYAAIVDNPELGPHLSKLPEELLPALSKFSFIARDQAEIGAMTTTQLEESMRLVRCLIVLCRNFDNIPLVASCDFVGHFISVATFVLKKLTDKTPDFAQVGTAYITSVCHFLECLYDPYFTWRAIIYSKSDLTAYRELQYQPCLLHTEVVPFIYDCLNSKLLEVNPTLSLLLVCVLTAVISGSHHNAIRAICPATSNLLMKLISAQSMPDDICLASLRLFCAMIESLKHSRVEQRQIEIAALVQTFCECCRDRVRQLENNEITVNKANRLIPEMIETLATVLRHLPNSEIVKDKNVLNLIFNVFERVLESKADRQLVAKKCAIALTAVLKAAPIKACDKNDIIEKFVTLVSDLKLSHGVLKRLLGMACESDLNDLNDLLSMRLQHGKVICTLISWLPRLSHGDQKWLCGLLLKICLMNRHSTRIASSDGVILAICKVLHAHQLLHNDAAHNLIQLMKGVALHSISPEELRNILLLLARDKKSHFNMCIVRGVLSAVLKQTVRIPMNTYFDIRADNEGITVPGINQWVNVSQGFTFCVWFRCNEILDAKENKRRQLLYMSTNSGLGVQIFIRSDGVPVIGIATKKEFFTINLNEFRLTDQNEGREWHSLYVIFSLKSRNIYAYFDHLMPLFINFKFPYFLEPFTVCTIGMAAPKMPLISTTDSQKPKNITSLLSASRIPNLINMVPPLSLLNCGSSDSHVKSFPLGIEESVCGPSKCLDGQIGHVLFLKDDSTFGTADRFTRAGSNVHLFFEGHERYLDHISSSEMLLLYSPLVSWEGECPDVSPAGKFPGTYTCHIVETWDFVTSMNAIGGIPVLLPIIELDIWDLSGIPKSDPRLKTLNFSETQTKEEFNPMTSFFTMLTHMLVKESCSLEQVKESLDLIGYLLSQTQLERMDGSVLVTLQLLYEIISAFKIEDLYSELCQHIIFNFKIWSQCCFINQIDHIHFVTTVLKEKKYKSIKKRYGVQFFLDVIRRFYAGVDLLSSEHSKIIRTWLITLVKLCLVKKTNVGNISAILKYIFTVKEEVLISEIFDMLIVYLESKACRDQCILLLYEVHSAELLYGLLIDDNFSMKIKEKIIRFIIILLKSEKVYDIYKARLRLQDGSIISSSGGMCCGLVTLLTQKPITLEVAGMLMDQFLMTDTNNNYAGALALTNALWNADIDIKLEIADRLLAAASERPLAASMLAKQPAWQDSITGLLVKRPINVKKDVPSADFMTFDEEPEQYDVLASTFEGVAGVLTDNINTAADSITSVVVSAIKRLQLEEIPVPPRKVIIRDEPPPPPPAPNQVNAQYLSESEEEEEEEEEEEDEENVPCESDTNVVHDGEENTSNETPKDEKSLNDEEEIENKEEELCYLVTNLLFTILWRGIDGHSADAWKERGQVIAAINLLGLNNEMYDSHTILKLDIIEMAVEASLLELQKSKSYHIENVVHLLKWVYDSVVLDPVEDIDKKCSTKLLEDVFGLIDGIPSIENWSEIITMFVGILLTCINSHNSELSAIASAKLHSIVQTRSVRTVEEGCYMLVEINNGIVNCLKLQHNEKYAFLLPVMRTLLEKLSDTFNYKTCLHELPALTEGAAFFEDFSNYCKSSEWETFLFSQVQPYVAAYSSKLTQLTEKLNVFWAECYEACKHWASKRGKEYAESTHRFQRQILLPLRKKQTQELSRFNALINQEKTEAFKFKRKWKLMMKFFNGPRGGWTSRSEEQHYWKLSPNENHRMRLKLVPNLFFNAHTNASNLRDHTGWQTTSQLVDDMTALSSLPKNHKAEVEDDLLSEDDFRLLTEIALKAPTLTNNEKILFSQECDLISFMTAVRGKLEITITHISFLDLSPIKDETERHDFKFPVQYLREVFPRQYNLRRSALEFFLLDQTNYFVNFTPTKVRSEVLKCIYGLRPPNLIYSRNKSPADRLKSGLTQRWMMREISNFEYLMHLNTLAGRTYNDLSQYPVFPWILADYTSDVLDLNNPASFRDLSKPIGVVNPRNEEEVRTKYENFEDPAGTIAKFHYGTHYSNSAGVLHYLVRVEPFTSLHIDLQSGRFDVADRQFHSIPQTWKLLMENPNDVKELIPEFFYFPEFLKNINDFDLGTLQGSKQRVHDVILPPWASSAEDFIFKHRKALESEYVSSNLHHWIDLIFGYKQREPAAVEALNVFYYCSYEGAVDLDAIKDPNERQAVEGMINNFGQTPRQLLKEPHPQRLSWEESVERMIKLERRLDLTLFLDNLKSFVVEVCSDKDPIVYLSVPRTPPKGGFLPVDSNETLVSVTKSGVVSCHSWLPYDRHSTKGFFFAPDPTINNAKSRKKLNYLFHPKEPINSKMFAISLDGKLLFCGGNWDFSLQVHSVFKCKKPCLVVKHSGIITCLALDQTGTALVTGSRDTTCVVWDTKHICVPNFHNGSNYPTVMHVLYGHVAPVTCVAVMAELDIVVSGSKDGTVNVHTLKEGLYTRTLYPLEGSPDVAVHHLSLSFQGHVAFSASDRGNHSIHVYSVNGCHLGSKYVPGQVTGLATANDSLVVADDAGDVTLHKLMGLHPIYDIPLQIPVQSVVVTPGFSHILLPLRDGAIAILGIPNIAHN